MRKLFCFRFLLYSGETFFNIIEEFRSAFNRYVKGAMELFKCDVKSIGSLDQFRDVFIISSENRKLFLVADNLEEQNEWIDAITNAKFGTSTGSNFMQTNVNMWAVSEPTMSLSSARSMSGNANDFL